MAGSWNDASKQKGPQRGLLHGLRRFTQSSWFQHGITSIIILNAVVIGLDTSKTLNAAYGAAFELTNQIFLAIFVLEAGLKIAAQYPAPWRYFKDGWNFFDFSIVVVSLAPATGQLATLARLARLMRVLRLISALPELRLIVSTLIRSIPSMANVLLLASIIFYVYGVAGHHLFHEVDPNHWRDLGISLLSLFRIVTLEDWTDIMYIAMATHPWAWIYFVSFVVITTFVVINLFIAVVINNLDEVKQERLRSLEGAPGRAEILKELKATQDMLAHLERRLQ